MDSITLKYQDATTAIIYSTTFSALRVKGFDPVDDLMDFPDVVHEIVDGTLIHQTIGVRRRFTVELGVLNPTQRLFCGNYWRSVTKWLVYTHDSFTETILVTRDTGVFEADWLDDTVLARYVVFYLQDKIILSDFPAPNPNPPTYDLDMYIKKKVAIVGYITSPETFETNVGKLASCDAPSGVYPTFNSANEKYHININGQAYQDCLFHVTAEETVVGGNIIFYVQRSDAGNANPDGNYYADIIISVVEIIP